MAAELFVKFENTNWYIENKKMIINVITSLETFVYQLNNEFWLKDSSDIIDDDYHVRIFLNNDDIMLEIDFHPFDIEKSLKNFLNWIRMNTNIIVQDEDGEISTW
ncbi:MAG: hypothetical protein JFR39_01550 [Muribaculaceae bacterium]|nr:hypothetical protein [Muribaculaceae bacterium]